VIEAMTVDAILNWSLRFLIPCRRAIQSKSVYAVQTSPLSFSNTFDRFTHGIGAFDLNNAIVTSQRRFSGDVVKTQANRRSKREGMAFLLRATECIARQNGPRQRRT
jgi:hypothetical protein